MSNENLTNLKIYLAGGWGEGLGRRVSLLGRNGKGSSSASDDETLSWSWVAGFLNSKGYIGFNSNKSS